MQHFEYFWASGASWGPPGGLQALRGASGRLRGAIFEPPEPPGSLREPPGRASGRLREPPVSDTQRHFATWQPQFSDTPGHFATSQPHFQTKGAGGMGAKPFRSNDVRTQIQSIYILAFEEV